MKEVPMKMLARVRLTGPLAPYRDVLWEDLRAKGYTALSALNIIRVAAHLSRWLQNGHRSLSDLNHIVIEEYLQHRRARGYVSRLTPRGLALILDSLRAIDVVSRFEAAPVDDSPVIQLLREFEAHLLELRGVQGCTANRYSHEVRPFLDLLKVADIGDLKALTSGVVSRYLLREIRRSKSGYLKYKVTALRAFLRFLHVRGLCADLSSALPIVAGYRRSTLPKVLPQEAVRRIVASCDRRTGTGRRDYAIILLLTRLALRAGEVAAIELDDLHWRRSEVVVRGKGSEGVLPLPSEVGHALAAYLKVRRPTSSSRKVFLQVSAPYKPLSSGGVQHVVRSAAHRAGLPPTGSHRLRHTAATTMLRSGASLPDIAQVLRHKRLETTAIYAKVDYLALRRVARPWPGGEG
jgi:integrase/recombinase XerD